MNVTIDKTDPLADKFTDCQVGDKYELQAEVTEDTPSEITLNVTDAGAADADEGAAEGEQGAGPESGPPTPSPMRKSMGGNPAIAVILGKGK